MNKNPPQNPPSGGLPLLVQPTREDQKAGRGQADESSTLIAYRLSIRGSSQICCLGLMRGGFDVIHVPSHFARVVGGSTGKQKLELFLSGFSIENEPPLRRAFACEIWVSQAGSGRPSGNNLRQALSEATTRGILIHVLGSGASRPE